MASQHRRVPLALLPAQVERRPDVLLPEDIEDVLRVLSRRAVVQRQSDDPLGGLHARHELTGELEGAGSRERVGEDPRDDEGHEYGQRDPSEASARARGMCP